MLRYFSSLVFIKYRMNLKHKFFSFKMNKIKYTIGKMRIRKLPVCNQLKEIVAVLCKAIFLYILSCSIVSGQAEVEEEFSGTHSAKYTNLNVPSVPAFILLDVTAAKVQQAGYTRSVKIDWTMKNYKNTPNVGLELQPLWLLYYNQSDLSRYRKASPLARKLSTLSVSVGTYNQDFWRQIAYAVKLNLYQGDDPLMNDDLDDATKEYEEEKALYKAYINDARAKLRKTDDLETIKKLKRRINDYKDSLFITDQNQKDANRIYKEEYLKENWNIPTVDIGFGKLRIYDIQNIPDSSKQILSGMGVWICGSSGVGYRGLLSGMLKFVNINNVSTKFLIGASYRYGNPKYNMYTEFSYDLSNDVYAPSGRSLEKSTFGMGGDFKINSIVQLNLGLRFNMDQQFKFTSLNPAANIICLMNL